MLRLNSQCSGIQTYKHHTHTHTHTHTQIFCMICCHCWGNLRESIVHVDKQSRARFTCSRGVLSCRYALSTLNHLKTLNSCQITKQECFHTHENYSGSVKVLDDLSSRSRFLSLNQQGSICGPPRSTVLQFKRCVFVTFS